jgi:hypothetical protein
MTVKSPLSNLRARHSQAAEELRGERWRSGCWKNKKWTFEMDIIRQLEAEQAAKIEAKRKLPEFQPGDTVRVQVRVTEGTRTRVQAYEGVCIARAGAGFQEISPSARFPMAKAWSACSRSTRRWSRRRDRAPRQGASRQALLSA